MKMKHQTMIYMLISLFLLSLFIINPKEDLDSVFAQDFDVIINPDDYPGSSDFERLQNALNDVPSTGATVLVPAKTYEGSNLKVPSNVRIVGMNGTVFKISKDSTEPFIVIEGKSKVSIENIIFDGNEEAIVNSYESLIFIDHGSSQILIFNNIFVNFKSIAIATKYSATSIFTRFIKIYKNKFYNGYGAAILLRGYYACKTYFLEYVEISQNTLDNLSVNGKIGVAFANVVNISDNLITSSEANLSGNIVVRGCKDVYVSNNSVVNCLAIAGIYIETNLLFPNAGMFIIERNQVIREIGKGFSVIGSQGVDAIFILRRNFFTKNSGPDIEAIGVTIYVYGNTIDTPSDLLLSSTAIVSRNYFKLAEQSLSFILMRHR